MKVDSYGIGNLCKKRFPIFIYGMEQKVVAESVIGEKSKKFAVRIIRFYKFLCEIKKEFVIAKQILRSGTSVGANVRESKNAQSNADFINKMSIALKEADETAYWLEILKESEIITNDEFNEIYPNCVELEKILTKIIKTSKAKT